MNVNKVASVETTPPRAAQLGRYMPSGVASPLRNLGMNMERSGVGWDRERSERLRSKLTDADLDDLKRRAEADPASLSLDEVGVLFLVTRDRIREIERKARGR